MIQGQRQVKLIGILGSESVGKTSVAYQLTGRLRTHGVLAEVVSDSGASLPFEPHLFDSCEVAWTHVMAAKVARISECALRSNVEVIVSDRTPVDQLAYFTLKHPDSALLPAFERMAWEWLRLYDLLYYFPADGTAFVNDSFREPTDVSRKAVDASLEDLAATMQRGGYPIEVAGGTHRERAEFVYHDVLAKLLDRTKAKRIDAQVRALLADRISLPVTDVRVLGSNSITRAHVASDNDDYDILIVLDCTPSEAREAYDLVQADRLYLEHVCETDLDIAVCAKGMEPHEV